MKTQLLTLAAIAAPLFALPASAHHSFAMFDQSKVSKIDGTVKELEYINPHAWLHVAVAQPDGKIVNWSFEMGSVSQLTRDGWNKETVKAGDKITVNFHPLKDGSHGGQFRTMVNAAGKTICQGGAGTTSCQQTPPP
jgi:hypothetical protein